MGSLILLVCGLAMLQGPQEPARNAHTMTGLDVLVEQGFEPLKNKRVGLITNQTGIDRNRRRNIELMRSAGVNLVALFSPEHGFLGTEDRSGLGDAVDTVTGIKVFSLYGATLRPTPQMMEGLDALVFDIADVGVRFYTYETTMAYGMEAAAQAKIPFFVLDRPNPVRGDIVEGPWLEEGNTSFAGYHPGTPARHGMTMGELARFFNAQRKIDADLRVVEMKDWRRSDWFDSTHQPWVNPSPNMRSLKAAILYPGVCLVEFAPNISVGRGTDAPFEHIGADFIDGRELALFLNGRNIPGLRVYPTSFTPTTSRFEGVEVQGVRFEVVDRNALPSVRLGIELACAIEKLYPGKVDWERGKRLIGSNDVVRRIAAGEDADKVMASFRAQEQEFERIRRPYLIYR